jgi:hypothetical protein
MLILILILLIIFSNQYLLINEELSERKNKVLTSYLEYLNKKSKYLNTSVKNIEQKVEYLYNYVNIQNQYFDSFSEMFQLLKLQNLISLNQNLESSFIYYFAGVVSKKRKFL